jgi:hypothetical protein
VIASVVSGPKIPSGRTVLPVTLLSMRWSVTTSAPVAPSARVGRRTTGTVVVVVVVVLIVVVVVLIVVLIVVLVDELVVVVVVVVAVGLVVVVVRGAATTAFADDSPRAGAPVHAPSTSTATEIQARRGDAAVRIPATLRRAHRRDGWRVGWKKMVGRRARSA